ncbi:MAG: hypothetical protein JWR07_4076 [Nevskia sp.]|nr:hypothetical protein [Nevskia sp.]
MNINLALISAVLDSVFKENNVARFGAIPLNTLTERWESIRLRRSDLTASIEGLSQEGLIELETRRDELWVRRKGKDVSTPPVYERLLTSVDRFLNDRAVDRIRLRRGDGYCGMDRRIAERGAARVSGPVRSLPSTVAEDI